MLHWLTGRRAGNLVLPATVTKRQEATLATRSVPSLIRRLGAAGFGKEFVDAAILPEWWDHSCWGERSLLPEIEIRVARFLEAPLSLVTDPESALEAPDYPGARLRRVRGVDRDRLGPAIHAAMSIADAVVRNLKREVPSPALPPADGLVWREEITESGAPLTLDRVVEDLWSRGIPVVQARPLPTPGFQSLAAVVEDRPVVVLGHKDDEPGRAAFRIAHEVGHIAAGDCAHDSPVVDRDEEILSDHEMEERADRYAIRAVVGGDTIPGVGGGVSDFRELAERAAAVERETGADAGAILFSWARVTGDYAMAVLATRALYLSTGAARILRKYFMRFVDYGDAPTTDQELMRAVVPDLLTADAPAD